MEDVIGYLERCIQESEHELKFTTQTRLELTQTERRLIDEIAAYKIALKAEKRKAGVEVADEMPTTVRTETAQASGNGQGTQAVKEIIASRIREAGAEGTTYKAVAEYLRSRGLKFHKNYPYVVIGKLKKAGHVNDENEKLVWK